MNTEKMVLLQIYRIDNKSFQRINFLSAWLCDSFLFFLCKNSQTYLKSEIHGQLLILYYVLLFGSFTVQKLQQTCLAKEIFVPKCGERENKRSFGNGNKRD